MSTNSSAHDTADEHQAMLEKSVARRHFDSPIGPIDLDSAVVWKTIPSKKYRNIVAHTYQSLSVFAEDMQAENRQRLPYEQLLTGLLFPGEQLQMVAPMRCTSISKQDWAGNELWKKKRMRVFFSDRRIFFTQAILSSQAQLSSTNAQNHELLTRHQVRISCGLRDRLHWTFEPLHRVDAQIIDCDFDTKATTIVHVLRPWWSLVLVTGAVPTVVYLVAEHATDDSLLGLGQDELALSWLGATAALLLGLWLMFSPDAQWNTLLRRTRRIRTSEKVVTKKVRTIVFGLWDEARGEQTLWRCHLDDDYTLPEAVNFLEVFRLVWLPRHLAFVSHQQATGGMLTGGFNAGGIFDDSVGASNTSQDVNGQMNTAARARLLKLAGNREKKKRKKDRVKPPEDTSSRVNLRGLGRPQSPTGSPRSAQVSPTAADGTLPEKSFLESHDDEMEEIMKTLREEKEVKAKSQGHPDGRLVSKKQAKKIRNEFVDTRSDNPFAQMAPEWKQNPFKRLFGKGAIQISFPNVMLPPTDPRI
jgi:hypothetical protein